MTNEELMRQISAGNMDAAQQLYKNSIGLIRSIAKECAADFGYLQGEGDAEDTAYVEELFRDLCAEGALAFYEQIQSGEYDPAKGRLTTYLYPYIKGVMYRWLKRQARYREHTLSIDDLAEDEDGDRLEFPVVDKDAFSPASIVCRKICTELLEELFEQLSAKDNGAEFVYYVFEDRHWTLVVGDNHSEITRVYLEENTAMHSFFLLKNQICAFIRRDIQNTPPIDEICTWDFDSNVHISQSGPPLFRLTWVGENQAIGVDMGYRAFWILGGSDSIEIQELDIPREPAMFYLIREQNVLAYFEESDTLMTIQF